MLFGMEVRMPNAAFADDPQELARILRVVANQVERDVAPGQTLLRDINGNTVGFYLLTEKGEPT